METFKDRLAFIMSTKEIKQADLVRRTGIKKSTISYYLKGRNIPNAENLRKIAIALNVQEEWLLGYTDVMERRSISSEEANSILATIKALTPEHQEIVLSLLQTLKSQEDS